MSHRWVWEELKSHKYVSGFGALLFVALVLFGLSSFYTEGSLYGGHDGLEFDDCSVDTTGHIVGCQVGNDDLREDLGGNFARENSEFWVKVEDVEPTGDSHLPQAYWLYQNGYAIEDDSFSNLHINYGDFKWNSSIESGLEEATTAKLSIDISTPGGAVIETDEASQYYNDEPECFGDYCGDVTHPEYYFNAESDRHAKHIMQSEVTVEASEIDFRDDGMYAKFNMAEIFDQGLELPGQFQSWSGRYATISEVGASGDIQVQFSIDTDGDGIVDSKDECQEMAGIPEKNGCPNEASKILSVDGPRNTTVDEEVIYSAEIQNPDDDSQSISWSNGDSGESTSYSWESTGNKSVQVTVDDGFTTESEQFQVLVEQKSLLSRIFEFFGGLWQVLNFSG